MNILFDEKLFTTNDKLILPCKCNEVYVNQVDDSFKGCFCDPRFDNKVYGKNKVVIDGRCDLLGDNCCLAGCTNKCNFTKNKNLKECRSNSALDRFMYPNIKGPHFVKATLDGYNYKDYWSSCDTVLENIANKEYTDFIDTVYNTK